MNMENCKKFNISDRVIVQLTDYGLDRLMQFNKCNSRKGLKRILGTSLNLRNMCYEDQLYKIMSIFGNDCFDVTEAFFTGNIIYIPIKSLK